MSPQRKMWLLALAFLFALLAFTVLVLGSPGAVDSMLATKVLLVQPEEIIPGSPAILTFLAVDETGKPVEEAVISVEITNPEYEFVALRSDFYAVDGKAVVAYNFQESGPHIVEASLKNKEGIRISPAERFVVIAEPAHTAMEAKLKGWGLLMGALLVGLLLGAGSAKRNVIK